MINGPSESGTEEILEWDGLSDEEKTLLTDPKFPPLPLPPEANPIEVTEAALVRDAAFIKTVRAVVIKLTPEARKQALNIIHKALPHCWSNDNDFERFLTLLTIRNLLFDPQRAPDRFVDKNTEAYLIQTLLSGGADSNFNSMRQDTDIKEEYGHFLERIYFRGLDISQLSPGERSFSGTIGAMTLSMGTTDGSFSGERHNLNRYDFHGLDLSETNMRGASLLYVDFEGTKLCGAILDYADIDGAYFGGADGIADLHGASLRGANLENVQGLSPENLLTAKSCAGARANDPALIAVIQNSK